MNLDNVLKNLDATLAPTEKTAAAAAPAATRASSLVDDAVRSVSSQPKLASATAEGALDKLAAHMASQSAEGAAKVAHTIGEAMADGFVSKMALYEQAAGEMQAKTASEIDPELIKIARFAKEDPRGFMAWTAKQAEQDDSVVRQAEIDGANELEQATFKGAAAHWDAGYEIGFAMGASAQ